MAEAQNKTKPGGATARQADRDRGPGDSTGRNSLLPVPIVERDANIGTSSAYRPQQCAIAGKQASVTSKPNVVEVKTTVGREPAAAPIIDAIHWKPANVETVAAYDPFALPAAFPQPRRVATGAKGGAEGLKAAGCGR